ncbi:WHG domain protein [Leptospira inadai serovar Lyme str. 10]|uniref:WHG domain protein n=2 Tax=Leptospira inadai serovar Lyme TaxID=293084 RepID=V6HSC1_9LEPT|nr:TetR/AcrR family transcriptional regulator [Leptospira inadai]EQA35489.1 WHG domain protein [Leptospira inadai serovar Lyme str. 10]PNV75411.1 TetR/AcrR family transcriptional regulator [Leptospira inadai serovar Lyme]
MPAKKKTKKPERAYHHGNLAETLKALALKRLEESKDSAFTVREIAREAGVSHAAAYRHFPSRRDLLAEISKDGFIGITKAFLEAEAKAIPGDSIDRLEKIGIAYVSFCVENPGYYRAMWHTDLGPKDDLLELQEAGRKAFLRLWETVLACYEEQVSDYQPVEIASAAWSIVHGFSTLINEQQLTNNLGLTRNSAKDAAKTLVRLLMSGIRKR